jgi:hypothetical protein
MAAMCCFSRPVESVSSTRIFARFTAAGTQAVVYQMNFEAAEDLAMILPLPVLAAERATAVKFVNLEGYTKFFVDMEKIFPKPQTKGYARSFGEAPAAAQTLPVEQVGAFEASYVPGIADFGRLDERFKLPEGVWEKLPAYREHGFAVFKLKQGRHEVHPMALSFRTSLGATLFFPTVHIHDGTVHEKEDFDHALYAQAVQGAAVRGKEWKESPSVASAVMKMDRCQDLIWGGGHIYRRFIKGTHKNEDTLAELAKLGGM